MSAELMGAGLGFLSGAFYGALNYALRIRRQPPNRQPLLIGSQLVGVVILTVAGWFWFGPWIFGEQS
jgi:hypothetical protein